MSLYKKTALFFVLFGLVLACVSAQPYLPDLKNEDPNSLDQRLKALGTTYKAEPLLAVYLVFGKNPEFVGRLLEKGCNPNQKALGSALSPLSLAITQNLSPRLVSLLLQSGARMEATVAGFQGNIIDVALDKQEYQNAGLLINANQRRLKPSRLVLSTRFQDYQAFFLDDLDEVRNILRTDDFSNALVWNLALAGNSKKVLRYLMDFRIEPNLNAPGSRYENTVGMDLLASNLDLLKYLLANGLSRDEVNFDKIYQKDFQEKDLDSVRTLRTIDPAPRPGLYHPALAAGPDFLRAMTDDLADLTRPALFDAFSTPPGSGALFLSGLLFPDGGSATNEQPLLVGLYEKSDFPTILPLLQANRSEAGLVGFYRYALAKKNLELVKNLVSFDAKKVRPELYAAALDSGIEPLRALTRNLEDFKNPALYSDASQDNGREILTNLLLRPAGGQRTLLERIFEKADFATILPIIQVLDPPAPLLAGKEFSGAYVAWLNRGNKDITSFGFSTPAVKGSVQGTQIVIVMPAPADVKALVAIFTVSGGQASVGNVPQISGATANDFSSPVLYTVTAQDGSTKTYTVTVTVPASPENPESAAVAPLPPSTP